MKCKLMSLLVVIGVVGCKADTGTVMYVVNAPVPDDSCVYGAASTESRLSSMFDPTQADGMGLVLSVHNGLNAKDTDLRVDDNGVNIRPDANHIQLEKATICYFDTQESADSDAEKDDPASCGSNVSEEVSVFGTVLAESSSTPDSGTNISVTLLGRDILPQAVSGDDFSNDAMLVEDSPSTAKYEGCKSVGVASDGSPDPTCATEISRTHRSQYENTFSTVAKIAFHGQTVSGAKVSSSPFLLPIDVVPGRAIDKTARLGECKEEKVICSTEQPNCEWMTSSGQRMIGQCVATITGTEANYKNGCLITDGPDFSTGDAEVVACAFRKRGSYPVVPGCEPELLGGSVEDYKCKAYEGDFACDGVDTIPVLDICGDGLVTGAEVCDDGNTVTEPVGCNSTCTTETT